MSDRPVGAQCAGEKPPVPPLTVWPTGQRDIRTQLHDSGCAPGTETDRHLIPPAIAAHAIATYTHPGDLVLDPDCGAGTVLVEALRASRHALGLTTEQRWWTLARANITAAKTAGSWRDGSVLDAQPTALATIRATGLVGRVGLVLTTLRTPTNDLTRNPDWDSDTDLDTAVQDLTTTMSCCEPLLRSGGHLVVIAAPRRRSDGSLADLPTRLIDAAASAGLVPVERCIALTAALRGSRVVPRASIAERRDAAHFQGVPIALTAHHEVLVFQLRHDAELASTMTGNSWLAHTVVIPQHRTHRDIEQDNKPAACPVGRRAA